MSDITKFPDEPVNEAWFTMQLQPTAERVEFIAPYYWDETPKEPDHE